MAAIIKLQAFSKTYRPRLPGEALAYCARVHARAGAGEPEPMGPIDAFIHFVNFFLPALGVGLLSAVLVKLRWRHALQGVGLVRLALWAVGACAAVLVAGLVITGRDGRMGTYLTMTVACALALV